MRMSIRRVARANRLLAELGHTDILNALEELKGVRNGEGDKLHPKHWVHTWISVGETLPDSDITVLICAPGGDEPVWLGYWDGYEWRYVDGVLAESDEITVTHWGDLPAPMEAH